MAKKLEELRHQVLQETFDIALYECDMSEELHQQLTSILTMDEKTLEKGLEIGAHLRELQDAEEVPQGKMKSLRSDLILKTVLMDTLVMSGQEDQSVLSKGLAAIMEMGTIEELEAGITVLDKMLEMHQSSENKIDEIMDTLKNNVSEEDDLGTDDEGRPTIGGKPVKKVTIEFDEED